MARTRTWEVVLTSSGFTLNGEPRTTFLVTEMVPVAVGQSITLVDDGSTPVDAAHEAFTTLCPDVAQPFSIDREYAGYWVSVYKVSKVEIGEQSASLCHYCREAFDTVTLRDHHENYLCLLRPGLRG